MRDKPKKLKFFFSPFLVFCRERLLFFSSAFLVLREQVVLLFILIHWRVTCLFDGCKQLLGDINVCTLVTDLSRPVDGSPPFFRGEMRVHVTLIFYDASPNSRTNPRWFWKPTKSRGAP